MQNTTKLEFVYMHSNQTNLSCGYNKSSTNTMHYLVSWPPVCDKCNISDHVVIHYVTINGRVILDKTMYDNGKSDISR